MTQHLYWTAPTWLPSATSSWLPSTPGLQRSDSSAQVLLLTHVRSSIQLSYRLYAFKSNKRHEQVLPSKSELTTGSERAAEMA
jgi:hypothetical protein